MAGYGKFERRIALLLENLPWVRNCIKESYKRLIYLASWRPRPKGILAPGVRLLPALPQPHINESFYGYYDKSPWSPDQSKQICHQKTTNSAKVDICVVDHKANTLKVVGQTESWTWQQGAMAQWVPSSAGQQLVYNSVQNGKLGCILHDLSSQSNTWIPWPVQAMHPSGNSFYSLNYKRLFRLRRCYGYAQSVSNFEEHQKESQDGIWRVALPSGEAKLIISLERLYGENFVAGMENAEHKVNHCIASPDGTHFIFLYRYVNKNGKFSRLYLSDQNGETLKLLLDDRMVSHYHWDGNEHVVAWARTKQKGDRYYRIHTLTGNVEVLGEGDLDRFGDGHCTVSPNGRYLLTDSYPDKARYQHLMIFDLKEKKRIEVASFYSPWKFVEDERCDLHPRWSPDSTMINIDSPHTGRRQNFNLDIRSLIKA